MPKRVCKCALSVWNLSLAVSSSVVLTINRRRRRCRRRVCTTKNVDEIPCLQVGPRRERHSIGHERTHSRIAHSPSIYLETFYQSIEAFFHPSVRVTLALTSQTIERARVHPYTHGNADTWAHALIRSCIMCVPEHKGACIYMSVPLNV